MITPILFDLSLTFPGLLSRLLSHSKPPFGSLRNSPRFRLLPSDYPLCWMSFGYSLRDSYNSTNVCTRSLFDEPFLSDERLLSSTLDFTCVPSDALSGAAFGSQCLDTRVNFFGSHLRVLARSPRCTAHSGVWLTLSHGYYG